MTADPAWPRPEDGWRHDAPDPPDAFAVPWGIGEALLLVGWSLAGQLVAQVVVAVAFGLRGTDELSDTAVLAIALFSQIVVLAGVAWWWIGRQRRTWRVLGPVRPEPSRVLTGLGIGISGYLVVVLVVELLNRALGPFDIEPQQVLQAASDGGALRTLLAVLVALVFAPVIEETIFRGILFQTLRARLGLFPGLVISAWIFGGAHLELIIDSSGAFRPEGLLPLAGLVLLGVWLAGAFHRTGTLLVPVVAHATFNATTLVLELVVAGG